MASICQDSDLCVDVALLVLQCPLVGIWDKDIL